MHSLVSSFSFTLWVGFYTLDKAATSPSVHRLALGDEPHQSVWPELLVVSQTCVIVRAAIFVFAGSQDPPMSRRED